MFYIVTAVTLLIALGVSYWLTLKVNKQLGDD